jgi:hypothetical protein
MPITPLDVNPVTDLADESPGTQQPCADERGQAGETSIAPAAKSDGALQGLARLMTMAFEGVDLTPLAATLIQRASADDANALMDLSTILQLQGSRSLGIATQVHALKARRLYELAPHRHPGIRLLALMAPGDLMTNTPLEFLIGDSDVSLRMLYLLAGEPIPVELPEHDVVFVAAGESDLNRALLNELSAASYEWTRRVINLPSRIPNTSRTRAFELLDGVRGVCMPPTSRVSLDELHKLATAQIDVSQLLSDGVFPLIVRPVDSHAGRGLAKVESATEVADYLLATRDSEFFISRFIDYRGSDGLFRKYRIVLIDGHAYPGHMGISEHWMIHYLNAGMAESAAKRAEEERFMDRFQVDFAHRHGDVLRTMYQRFGLDYLVIDCGETVDGELLLFEICTGAVVHAMDPVDIFPYKRPHMDAVFAAFRAMLVRSIETTDARVRLPQG